MNTKSFLLGVATTLVCVAIGVAICCGICKKCDKQPLPPTPPCKTEQGICPQKPCQPDFRRDCRILKHADEMQLSEEQISQIKELQKAKHKTIKAEKRKFDESVRNILTDEQKAKWDSLKKAPKCKKDKPKCPKQNEAVEVDDPTDPNGICY